MCHSPKTDLSGLQATAPSTTASTPQDSSRQQPSLPSLTDDCHENIGQCRSIWPHSHTPSASRTNKVIILTRDSDNPLGSVVKEVDSGSTVTCYVPRSVAFGKAPCNLESNEDNIVRIKCTQIDVNFSMALVCKPQQLPKNCLVVWTADDLMRRQAMWSSPKNRIKEARDSQVLPLIPLTNEEPSLHSLRVPRTSFKVKSGQDSSVSGHTPDFQSSRLASKKYQGKVPNIVALFTNQTKSRNKSGEKDGKVQDPPSAKPKVLHVNHSGRERIFWQQKRFSPVSKEIHKFLSSNKSQTPTDVQRKESTSSTTTSKRVGFNENMGTTTPKVHKKPILDSSFPPPPSIPVPPVPQDTSSGPGTSSQSHDFTEANSSWQDYTRDENDSPNLNNTMSFSFRPHRLESVAFINPHTQQTEYEASFKDDKVNEALLPPSFERIKKGPTCLYIKEDLKSYHINRKKISAVIILSVFVVALILSYLVYFL